MRLPRTRGRGARAARQARPAPSTERGRLNTLGQILRGLVGAQRRKRKPRVAKSGTCIECGCTDRCACDGGCSWVNAEHTVCSACLEKLIRARGLALHRMLEESAVPLL